MLDEKKIEEMQDMLSHVIDMFSAESSCMQCVKRAAGDVSWTSKLTGETLSVSEMVDRADNANQEAYKTIVALRKMLQEIA